MNLLRFFAYLTLTFSLCSAEGSTQSEREISKFDFYSQAHKVKSDCYKISLLMKSKPTLFVQRVPSN